MRGGNTVVWGLAALSLAGTAWLVARPSAPAASTLTPGTERTAARPVRARSVVTALLPEALPPEPVPRAALEAELEPLSDAPPASDTSRTPVESAPPQPEPAAADPPDGNPIEALLAGTPDIPHALDLLAALPDEDRSRAAWRVGQRWATARELHPAILDALRAEQDVQRLVALGELIRGGAGYYHRTPEFVNAALDLVRYGEPAARRCAAARAVIRGDAGQFDPPPRWVQVLEDVVRHDADPSVVGAVAEVLVINTMIDPKPGYRRLFQALEASLARLPAGEERRRVVFTCGEARFRRSGPTSLFAWWKETRDRTLSAEIVDAAATIAGSGGGGDDPLRDVVAARRTFLEMYAATPDVTMRTRLAVAGAWGFWLVEHDPASRRFLEDVRDAESDPTLRARLGSACEALEAGAPNCQIADVLRGR